MAGGAADLTRAEAEAEIARLSVELATHDQA